MLQWVEYRTFSIRSSPFIHERQAYDYSNPYGWRFHHLGFHNSPTFYQTNISPWPRLTRTCHTPWLSEAGCDSGDKYSDSASDSWDSRPRRRRHPHPKDMSPFFPTSNASLPKYTGSAIDSVIETKDGILRARGDVLLANYNWEWGQRTGRVWGKQHVNTVHNPWHLINNHDKLLSVV